MNSSIYASFTQSPFWLLTAGAVMISFSGVWVAMLQVKPGVSAFYRLFFGGIFLLGAALWRREIVWKGWRALGIAILSGLFLALDLSFWHRCIPYVGPGLATILVNFEVFLLAAVGFVFFKEKISLHYILALPVAFAGLLLIIGFRWSDLAPSYRTGIFYGLITAFCYAVYILLLRKLQADEKKGPTFYTIMLVSFIAAIFLIPDVLHSPTGFAVPDGRSLLVLVVMGLMSQALGWICISSALPRVRASHAGLILLLQPSLSFVWDVLFFQRSTSLTNWVGVVLALFAIRMGMRTGNKTSGSTT